MPNCTIYNSQGEKLAQFATEPFGSSITIGRSSQCNIPLKGHAETAISRVHLILVKGAFGYSIKNNGKSGMYKDCIKYDECELKEGDIIRFANLFLAFGDQAGPANFDLTWKAETEDGAFRAVLWPGLNSVGASHDNYVMVRTNDISRVHAYIRVLGANLFLKSATLNNPTLINGNEVGEGEVAVRPDDVIRLGETDVKIINAVRVSLTEAKVQVGMRRQVALSNSDSVNNRNFMYLILALFTIVITLLAFLAFKVI